jgi:hypothetical protein
MLSVVTCIIYVMLSLVGPMTTIWKLLLKFVHISLCRMRNQSAIVKGLLCHYLLLTDKSVCYTKFDGLHMAIKYDE